MFRATKTYGHNLGLSTSFRQHRAQSHCRFMHGYALEIRIEFEAEELDENGWVIDFGSLKPLKAALEEFFDHKTLVQNDDPHIEWFREGMRLGTMDVIEIEGMGCEFFTHVVAQLAYRFLTSTGQWDRVKLALVEVKEHPGNSAIWLPKVAPSIVS